MYKYYIGEIYLMKNKKVIILISFIIALIIVLIVLLAIKPSFIQKTFQQISQEEENEELIVDGIKCDVYDNISDKLKVLITIQRVDGIDTIEYTSISGEAISLNCNKKQKVSIDYQIELDKAYYFKVISNGIEKTETVILDENYIDDYVKINPYDASTHIAVDMEFNSHVNPSYTKYYKLGNASWKTYSSTIALSLDNFPSSTLKTSERTLPIYAKFVDSAGNTIQTETTAEVTKFLDFDIFNNVEVSGNNLSSYGITGSWSYNNSVTSTRLFGVRNMGMYFPQGGIDSFSASFTVPIPIPMKANQLYFTSQHSGIDDFSQSYCTAVVYYKDGTSTSSSTNTLNGYRGQGSKRSQTFNSTVNLQNKEISSIRFNMSARRNGGGLRVVVQNMILKRCSPDIVNRYLIKIASLQI